MICSGKEPPTRSRFFIFFDATMHDNARPTLIHFTSWLRVLGCQSPMFNSLFKPLCLTTKKVEFVLAKPGLKIHLRYLQQTRYNLFTFFGVFSSYQPT